MALEWSDLIEEQKVAVGEMAAWLKQASKPGHPKRVFKTFGPAGTGKSSLVEFALEEAGLSEDDTCPVGPTGMSAQVMKRKGIKSAATIHSSIYTPPKDVGEALDDLKRQIVQAKGQLSGSSGAERERILADIASLENDARELRRSQGEELEWILNRHGRAASSRVIICDEGSMVGGRLKQDLEALGVPILYLADDFQLSPIDKGESVCYDSSGRLLKPDVQLTQLHRQAEGSPIIRYSRDIRLAENYAGLKFFGKETGDDGGMLIRLQPGQLTDEHLAAAQQVICGFNNTRHSVNGAVREVLGRGERPYPTKGDKLVCLKNHKDYGLVNGSIGTAASDYYDFNGRDQSFAVDVELDDGRQMAVRMLVPYFQFPGDARAMEDLPFWAKKKFAHFDYGYALTCHKAQGTQYNRGVVVEEPFGGSDLERRRWRYTAATRFEKFLIVEAPSGRR